MAISFVGIGLRGTGVSTTAQPVAYTTTARQAGDGHLMTSLHKVVTVSMTITANPTGWTLLGSAQVGTGTEASGTGPFVLTAWWREEVTGTDAAPSLATSAANTGAGWNAHMMTYRKAAGETWAVSHIGTGSDNDNNTTLNVTSSGTAALATGDYIAVNYGTTDETMTMTTAPTIAGTGLTVTSTRRIGSGTTQGNDMYQVGSDGAITAGSGTLAPTIASAITVASPSSGAQFVKIAVTTGGVAAARTPNINTANPAIHRSTRW